MAKGISRRLVKKSKNGIAQMGVEGFCILQRPFFYARRMVAQIWLCNKKQEARRLPAFSV
ncbi:MAG: hypothetical protein IKW79_06380 [Schwartzia sp.]|nr:hypothetical protein [Schwartzia sp. (in: firmicutes)]